MAIPIFDKKKEGFWEALMSSIRVVGIVFKI